MATLEIWTDRPDGSQREITDVRACLSPGVVVRPKPLRHSYVGSRSRDQ